MTERIPESNYQQLQHSISESEWDAKAVMQDVAENTNLSLEFLTGEKGLILDESGNEKAGEKSDLSGAAIYRECRESVQFASWSICGIESWR